MNEKWRVRRRQLPHVDVHGHPYFVTACLQGSLAAAGLKAIRRRREELAQRPRPAGFDPELWQVHQSKLVFKFIDHLLDSHSAVCHFNDDRLAGSVEKAFLHFAGQRYQLLAYVIMPSHHHWLFMPLDDWVEQLVQTHGHRRSPREVICHSVQSYSAHQCNRMLGTSGAFWQTETFDHFARDEAECYRIIDYIEQNPVIAGLVEQAHQYRWSSAYRRHLLGIPIGAPL